MKKKYSIFTLILLLGISSYSYGFNFPTSCNLNFSFLKPTNLFFGACSFIRNRLPFTSKSYVDQITKEKVADLYKQGEVYKDHLINKEINPLKELLEGNGILINSLQKKIGELRSSEQKNFECLEEKFATISSDNDEIKKSLKETENIYKQTIALLNKSDQEIEALVNKIVFQEKESLKEFEFNQNNIERLKKENESRFFELTNQIKKHRQEEIHALGGSGAPALEENLFGGLD